MGVVKKERTIGHAPQSGVAFLETVQNLLMIKSVLLCDLDVLHLCNKTQGTINNLTL